MTAPLLPQSVLIVDDQPDVAIATETVLVEIGVDKVTIAGAAPQALWLLDQQRFDLAVLDYDMGTGTGWIVAQRLCEDGIRMIVTTHHERVTLPTACADAAILRRPYDLNLLARLVAVERG